MDSIRRMTLIIHTVLTLSSILVSAQKVAPTPGQPLQSGTIGAFSIVGNSLVSAQQIFLGTASKLYIVDKVENNPTPINGHPAWASEYDDNSNTGRPMDVLTNTFCAGGNVLGNGTWLNVGGNQAVVYGGQPAPSQDGVSPYFDPDGRQSIRGLDPCDDQSCNWRSMGSMTTQRWYPSLETLEDGSMIILGGCTFGGFVNDAAQNNPTYEFFPSKGAPVVSPILQDTLPVNLYPLTWLLPSGKLLLQSNFDTRLLDYHTNTETPLDAMPDAVRTYPASAGTTMLALTPANNWTATIMFCGGSNIPSDKWTLDWNIAEFPASTSCVRITPDVSSSYVQDDPLPVGRSMANLIYLPDGKILCLNGASTGTAGYGNTSWAIGMSYADNPVFLPVVYDPNAPAGKRWSSDGLQPSTIARMYHSTASLLPDGSIIVGGSNPNSDLNIGPEIKYFTEYRLEKFYPSYYNKRRPEPQGLPTTLSYGGESFDIKLAKDDIFGDLKNLQKTTVVVIRTGFSTHAINMGQRYVQLNSTFSGNADGSATLHVSQLPPNPAILAPGPAFIFVVVNGVPSIGVEVMCGSGQLGAQQILAVQALPSSSNSASSGSSPSNDNKKKSSALTGIRTTSPTLYFLALSVLAGFW